MASEMCRHFSKIKTLLGTADSDENQRISYYDNELFYVCPRTYVDATSRNGDQLVASYASRIFKISGQDSKAFSEPYKKKESS